jgi:hypothetical protein
MCILIYLYSCHLHSAISILREAIHCKQIKLLITSTFAGSWFEIQQPIIGSLREYMVGCVWSGLRRLSHSVLDSLNLNFSYTETSTDVDLRHHGSSYLQIEPLLPLF